MTTNNKRYRSGEESEVNTGRPSRSRKTSLSSPSDGPKQHRDEHVTPDEPKEKPNYEESGRLKADLTVTQNGVVLKHAEPDDAADPPERPKYRMYVFDGDNIVDTIRLSERSWYMYGRDSRVCTVLVDDKSVSKQHAVIQFRRKVSVDKYGDTTEQIKPYLIDLESSNGTFLNKEEVPQSRYIELREKDMIQFGDSPREYLIIEDK